MLFVELLRSNVMFPWTLDNVFGGLLELDNNYGDDDEEVRQGGCCANPSPGGKSGVWR